MLYRERYIYRERADHSGHCLRREREKFVRFGYASLTRLGGRALLRGRLGGPSAAARQTRGAERRG